MLTSLRGHVRGRVQGVGFRYFVYRCAQAEGLSGYAINLADGRVEFLLQGDAAAVERVLAQVRSGPRHARVDDVSVVALPDYPAREGFATG